MQLRLIAAWECGGPACTAFRVRAARAPTRLRERSICMASAESDARSLVPDDGAAAVPAPPADAEEAAPFEDGYFEHEEVQGNYGDLAWLEEDGPAAHAADEPEPPPPFAAPRTSSRGRARRLSRGRGSDGSAHVSHGRRAEAHRDGLRACLFCAQTKRRCNGLRPCQRCVHNRRTEPCVDAPLNYKRLLYKPSAAKAAAAAGEDELFEMQAAPVHGTRKRMRMAAASHTLDAAATLSMLAEEEPRPAAAANGWGVTPHAKPAALPWMDTTGMASPAYMSTAALRAPPSASAGYMPVFPAPAAAAASMDPAVAFAHMYAAAFSAAYMSAARAGDSMGAAAAYSSSSAAMASGGGPSHLSTSMAGRGGYAHMPYMTMQPYMPMQMYGAPFVPALPYIPTSEHHPPRLTVATGDDSAAPQPAQLQPWQSPPSGLTFQLNHPSGAPTGGSAASSVVSVAAPTSVAKGAAEHLDDAVQAEV